MISQVQCFFFIFIFEKTLFFELLDASSFQNVNKWIEYVREERGTDVLVVLIGNKIDAAEKRYP